MQRRRTKLRPLAWVALPLVLCAADLISFPLFESSAGVRPLSVESLLRTGRQRVGRIRLHDIEATLDTLDRPAFAAQVRDGPSAIVIPCFVASFDPEPELGQLGKYVQQRLNTISPADSARLSALLESRPMDKAAVNDIPLHIPPRSRAAFPFDHLLVVTLARESEHGTGDEGVFGRAVPLLMQIAAADKILTLVLPAIGYNWGNKHSISFDSLYEPLFAGLQSGGAPRTIVLDLYRGWPTFSIEHAVGAIDAGLEHFFLAYPTTSLYRQDVRLLLFLAAVCLLASSRFGVLDAKSVAKITTVYFGLCLTAGKFVDLIATGWSGMSRTMVQVILFASLACLFPIIVRWKSDQIFAKEKI